MRHFNFSFFEIKMHLDGSIDLLVKPVHASREAQIWDRAVRIKSIFLAYTDAVTTQ